MNSQPTARPPSLVGMVVDTVHFDVEAGKIREFARASHAEDPAHVDPAEAVRRGFATPLATATHVVVAGHHRDQQGFVQKLGLDIGRVVVGSTSWEYLRPLRAGDSLSGTRTVVSDQVKQRADGTTMRLLGLETEYVDRHGVITVRQRETLIERGSRP